MDDIDLTNDDWQIMVLRRRAKAAEEEVDQLKKDIICLQAIIISFANRIAAQSALLSKHAEKS